MPSLRSNPLLTCCLGLFMLLATSADTRSLPLASSAVSMFARNLQLAQNTSSSILPAHSNNHSSSHPPSQWADACSAYGLSERQASDGTQPPRVMDCFLASNELDLMEIRLRELEAVVDVFVVLESRMTFRGTPRQLHFPRIMNKLPAAVLKKVEYVVLDALEGADAWAKESYQRNALFSVGLQKASPPPQPGDILMVSDCDEIPKPAFVAAMKHCAGLEYPLSMQAAHHYYSFSLSSSNVDKVWNQPRAALFGSKASSRQTAVQLRGGTVTTYPNSSWHCSSCFNNIAAMRMKIASFSHSELDTPEHNNVSAITSRVQRGKDLFNRPQMQFRRDTSADMPAFIKQHPTRFSYLISRDVADAGFRDLGMPGAA